MIIITRAPTTMIQSTKSTEQKLLPILLISLATTLVSLQVCAAKENQTDLFDSIKKYDSCVIASTYSYLYPVAMPPKTMDELKSLCKSQNEAFKCIKERIKGSTPILKRGLLSYVQSRQRQHKRVCSNFDSDISKRFVADNKCNLEKNFQAHKRVDEELMLSLIEIVRRSYNDSGIELKYICCTFLNYRQRHIDSISKECSSRATVEEMVSSIVPHEINLICEDEDKLMRICPKLEPLPLAEPASLKAKQTYSASALALYLIATLGEPNKGPILE